MLELIPVVLVVLFVNVIAIHTVYMILNFRLKKYRKNGKVLTDCLTCYVRFCSEVEKHKDDLPDDLKPYYKFLNQEITELNKRYNPT